MPQQDATAPRPEGASGKQRARRRKRVIENSSHREEYDRLLKAGWSSVSLERYAQFRYGEDVPSSTIRTYRQRQPWAAEVKVERFGEILDPERAVDVLGERAALIKLQVDRIAIDHKHEKEMGKLFGSTRGEIATLSSLLDAHKADLQDLGLMGKAGETLTVNTGAEQADAPRSPSLSEALGVDPKDEAGMARVLHMRLKATGTEPPSVNGNGSHA